MSLTLLLISVLFFGSIGLFAGFHIMLSLNILILLASFWLFLPFRFYKNIALRQNTSVRFDERRIMFSRLRLKAGTERFEKYYKDNPEHKKPDDEWRKEPGLLGKDSLFYQPMVFAAADAAFDAVEAFHPMGNGAPKGEAKEIPATDATKFIKKWMRSLGTKDCGIARMESYHFYSHKGRGENYGKEIIQKHEYGIAFTVEMDFAKMKNAPYAPTVMESAQQYLHAGTLATELALFIRHLGYDAQTHIDGQYDIICPLVARDAGLGEIGRMGLLMTPDLGPRVRIAVVTTNMPLQADAPKARNYMTNFCDYCRKCADVCPSRAIPFDKPKEQDGSIRWKIDDAKCFHYWCKTGTDCGRCMISCPFSHPNNFFHMLIRQGIRYFPNFARMAAKLDDVFYGKKPAPAKPVGWLRH